MKVGRGAPKKAASNSQAPVPEKKPGLRVGIPNKTYTPPMAAPSPDTTRERFRAAMRQYSAPPGDDGWFAAVAASGPPLGLDVTRDGWHCHYGCAGGMSGVDGVAYHHHTCLYWSNEGKDKTPF